MNASGRPNTCKPRGIGEAIPPATGARVSNAYGTCPRPGHSPVKTGLMPHGPGVRHRTSGKAQAGGDGHAWH